MREWVDAMKSDGDVHHGHSDDEESKDNEDGNQKRIAKPTFKRRSAKHSTFILKDQW